MKLRHTRIWKSVKEEKEKKLSQQKRIDHKPIAIIVAWDSKEAARLLYVFSRQKKQLIDRYTCTRVSECEIVRL